MIGSTRPAALFSTIDTFSTPPVAGNCCPVSEAVDEGVGSPAYFPWLPPVLPPKPKPPVEPPKTGGVLKRVEDAVEWAIEVFKNFASKLTDMLSDLKQLPSWMRWF